MAKSRCIRVRDKKVKKVRSIPEKEICDALYKFKASYTYESGKISYVEPKTYTPDFIVTKKDGLPMFIEVKGHFRPGDTKKYLALMKYWPNMDFRFIFQNANKKLRKGAKSTYGDWADKHGIKYGHQEIPQEWWDEML